MRCCARGARRGPHQVPGRLVVAIGVARAVHDGRGTVHRGLDALVLEQLAVAHSMPSAGSWVRRLSTRRAIRQLEQLGHKVTLDNLEAD